jgi:hypothetical protein
LGPALNSDEFPMLFMGACALFGGALSLLLPETLGTPMMISLDEVDGLSERTKPGARFTNC